MKGRESEWKISYFGSRKMEEDIVTDFPIPMADEQSPPLGELLCCWVLFDMQF